MQRYRRQGTKICSLLNTVSGEALKPQNNVMIHMAAIKIPGVL